VKNPLIYKKIRPWAWLTRMKIIILLIARRGPAIEKAMFPDELICVLDCKCNEVR
jgi:hypothetical protein